MNIAFLFPGQGSQSTDMLDRLPNDPVVTETLGIASELLGQDVSDLDSQSALHSNVAIQICLLVAGVAAARTLNANGVTPQAVAGLSVGAYAAAVACGSLDFQDSLVLVKRRAELMESAFPTGYGMSVIVGLTESKLSQLVNSLYSEREPIFVSNINTPLQMTVSGSNSALERLETAAGKIGARKAERLRVSVPSHCPLYEQAASVLEHAITSIAMKESRIPYISNIKARPLREPRAIGVDLARNIANPVRWHDSLCVLEELGTELFVEVNPGDILTKLATEAFPLRRAISLERSSLAYLLKLTKLEPKQ